MNLRREISRSECVLAFLQVWRGSFRYYWNLKAEDRLTVRPHGSADAIGDGEDESDDG